MVFWYNVMSKMLISLLIEMKLYALVNMIGLSLNNPVWNCSKNLYHDFSKSLIIKLHNFSKKWYKFASKNDRNLKWIDFSKFILHCNCYYILVTLKMIPLQYSSFPIPYPLHLSFIKSYSNTIKIAFILTQWCL